LKASQATTGVFNENNVQATNDALTFFRILLVKITDRADKTADANDHQNHMFEFYHRV
jgi:hypothetical protein